MFKLDDKLEEPSLIPLRPAAAVAQLPTAFIRIFGIAMLGALATTIYIHSANSDIAIISSGPSLSALAGIGEVDADGSRIDAGDSNDLREEHASVLRDAFARSDGLVPAPATAQQEAVSVERSEFAEALEGAVTPAPSAVAIRGSDPSPVEADSSSSAEVSAVAKAAKVVPVGSRASFTSVDGRPPSHRRRSIAARLQAGANGAPDVDRTGSTSSSAMRRRSQVGSRLRSDRRLQTTWRMPREFAPSP